LELNFFKQFDKYLDYSKRMALKIFDFIPFYIQVAMELIFFFVFFHLQSIYMITVGK